VASALLLLAPGCNSSARERIPARQQAPGGAVSADLLAAATLNSLVADSDAAVIALVRSVTEPRWNSTDGRAWTDDEAIARAGTVSWQYRDATVSIEQVIFKSDRLEAAPGTELTLRLFGSGRAGRDEARLARRSVGRDEISGPFEPRMRVIALLAAGQFPMEGGLVPVIRLVGHYQGNWELVGADARNLESARSAKEQDLVRMLLAERQAGRAPLPPTPAQ